MTLSFSTATLLGLVAAIGFGLGDLCARTAARRIGSLRTMFFGGLQGLVVLSCWLGFGGAGWPQHGSVLAWSTAVVAGFLNLAATAALFRAFATGTLALVAPVIASYGAVTVIFSLLSGEQVTAMRAAGVACAVAGVALASAVRSRDGDAAPARRRGLQAGLGWALTSALGYGATFWLLGRFAIPELGGVVPVWLYYLAEVAVLALVAASGRMSLALPVGTQIPLVLGCGVMIIAAYVAFAVGLESGEIAIVTVLTSLSSAVTVLGAALFLGDRLARRQWAGAALILVGLVLINSGL